MIKTQNGVSVTKTGVSKSISLEDLSLYMWESYWNNVLEIYRYIVERCIMATYRFGVMWVGIWNKDKWEFVCEVQWYVVNLSTPSLQLVSLDNLLSNQNLSFWTLFGTCKLKMSLYWESFFKKVYRYLHFFSFSLPWRRMKKIEEINDRWKKKTKEKQKVISKWTSIANLIAHQKRGKEEEKWPN